MKLDLIPLDKFCKLNNLQEITNPVLCEKGNIPTANGLLSTEIFGVSMKDRESTFAYIDLGHKFFHPFIYKQIKRLDRRIEYIVSGTKYYVIQDGKLVEDENGNTGVKWIYDNWDKIKWEKNQSSMRNERVDLLTGTPKDVIFTDKWPVFPAYYRDMNLQKREMSHDEVNDMYSKLIRLSDMGKNSNTFDFVLYSVQASVQFKLVDIYNYFKEKLEKKHGLFRKALMGKNIDYGARLVISAPNFTTNKPEEMKIDFLHSGLPLTYATSLFYPFMMVEVKNWIMKNIGKFGTKYTAPDGKTYELENLETYYDNEYIKKKIIERFIYGYQDRFVKVEVPLKNCDKTFHLQFEAIEKKTGRVVKRDLCWADVLYQCAVEVTADKHVVVTRYPVLDYFGTFTNKIHVKSTTTTVHYIINGKEYGDYPLINYNLPPEKIATAFSDTLCISNLYLGMIGGDYDGDQVTVKPLFTQEANLEAEKLLLKKSNILNIQGKNVRHTTNEGIQTLYQLTRRYE